MLFIETVLVYSHSYEIKIYTSLEKYITLNAETGSIYTNSWTSKGWHQVRLLAATHTLPNLWQ
jgi:hypothetical protein